MAFAALQTASAPARAALGGRFAAAAEPIAFRPAVPAPLRRSAFGWPTGRRDLHATAEYSTGTRSGDFNSPTSSGPASSPSPNPPSPEEVIKKAQEANELIQEIIMTAVKTGPAGPARAFKAAEAFLSTAREFTNSGFSEPIPVLMRKLFERLGATYIKLGQFVASSPTIFPAEYVLEFQKCLDQADQVPYSTIQSIIRQELGRPINDVFLVVDEVPLASASIAQVHRAVLKDSNKEVVIKVLKPGVKDTLVADLNFLYLAAKVLQFLNPELSRTSVVNILEDIRTSMMEEVDFVKESQNIAAFVRYLDGAGITAATAPFVYTEFTSTRMLTMEYLKGVPLTDLSAIRSVTNNDPEATLIAALNTWFGSVLACESFHADVHAGNLLVLPDGRVGFIDFGIVGRIKPQTWSAIQAFLASASSENYETMARALVTMGATEEEVDTAAFAKDLEKLFLDINSLDSQVVVDRTMAEDGAATRVAAGVSFDEDQVNKLVIDIVQVGESYGLRFPREFGLLLKQILYFDRYVRLLAPELQMMTDQRIQMAQGGAVGSSFPSFDQY